MQYPVLYAPAASRETVEVFGGYNHNLRIGAGEFYDMENMTGDRYPVLSPRDKRGIYGEGAAPGGLIAKDSLCCIRGTDFVMNEYPVHMGLADGPKQLVSMGAYVLIFPDRKWINTLDLTDWGSIDAAFTTVSDVTFTLCALSGEPYGEAVVSDTAPAQAEDLALWIDTSASPHVLKQYSGASGVWTAVAATYVRLSSPGIGKAFSQYDGVTLSGILQQPSLCGGAVIWERGDDFILVPGIIDRAFTQEAAAGAVTVERKMPQLDHVTECGNRLWGCRYGLDAAGQPVNELYACKLGDFKNWNCFMGLSTDSWACAVGTDGPFTGAVTHLGHPVFFKEHCLHKVYTSAAGAHQVQDTPCRGVERGSERSLAIVGETLFYKSSSGICAYDGSLPTEVSQALGEEVYTAAVGGAVRGRYYVSMEDTGGQGHLFVYDTARGMWHRQDGLRVSAFCACRGELYAIDRDSGRILTMLGSGTREEGDVCWMVQTGELGLSAPDRKYITRLVLRLSLEPGAEADIFIRYAHGEPWLHVCSLRGTGLDSRAIPIRPRRCDHLTLRLEGRGMVKLYSLTKQTEEGSDRA